MLTTLYSLVWLSALSGVTALVLWKGGARERQAIAIVILGWMASMGVQGAAGALDPVVGLLGVDGAALAALLALVWRSGRRWPVAAAGFQSMALAVDVLRVARPDLNGWFYLTALSVMGYGLLASIAVGAMARPAQR